MYIYYDMDIQALQQAEVAEKAETDSVDSVICAWGAFIQCERSIELKG